MSYLFLLEGDDRKSKGQVDIIISDILESPSKIDELVPYIQHPNIIVSIRTAHALLSISKTIPNSIEKYETIILHEFFNSSTPEVLWQIAQFLKVFDFSEVDQKKVKSRLEFLLTENHKFLVAHSMEALSDHLVKYNMPINTFIENIKQITSTSSPALQARGRKILKKLQR